jgi:hypothetical protein
VLKLTNFDPPEYVFTREQVARIGGEALRKLNEGQKLTETPEPKDLVAEQRERDIRMMQDRRTGGQ